MKLRVDKMISNKVDEMLSNELYEELSNEVDETVSNEVDKMLSDEADEALSRGLGRIKNLTKQVLKLLQAARRKNEKMSAKKLLNLRREIQFRLCYSLGILQMSIDEKEVDWKDFLNHFESNENHILSLYSRLPLESKYRSMLTEITDCVKSTNADNPKEISKLQQKFRDAIWFTVVNPVS